MIRTLLLGLLVVLTTSAVGGETPTMPEIKATLESGQPDKAIEQIDVLLANNPDDPEARFLKGLILVNQNMTEKAITIFEALTKDYPELPEPYNNLAVSYSALGRFDDARKALNSAITTHPSYATAHENLGNIYAMMAAEAYDHALSLDEENTAARDKLALMSELFSIETINKPPQATRKIPTATTEAPDKPIVIAKPTISPPAIAVAGKAPENDPEISMPLIAEAQNLEAEASNNNTPDLEQGLLSTALSWAKAWSDKDSDAYLSFYHTKFKPNKRMSLSSWEKQRRQRIAKPSFIEVEIINPVVTLLGDNKAKIVFLQAYNSDTYEDESQKMLQLEKSGDSWKITREVSLQ
ncbi:Uncharacterized protein Tbd_1903 [hydrothermal vent metagenome]|uniref:Uncharacterized protein Tbd_1903 n=1 Tax=hydrothermal vent metagenome TaxID=652676 RepID=A0A3B1AQ79_9ZZZZ